MERIVKKMAAALAALLVALAVAPVSALAADSGSVPMFRLYNQWTWEHFYTASIEERDTLVNAGWAYEAIGWWAPESSDTPVYRLYNPYTYDHHYTTDAAERDACVNAGWRDEGIGWYSSDAKTVPVLREYNPYAKTGTHNYTASQSEHDNLVAAGWRDEGIGWYGVTPGDPSYVPPAVVTSIDITNVRTSAVLGENASVQATVSIAGNTTAAKVASEGWDFVGGSYSDSVYIYLPAYSQFGPTSAPFATAGDYTFACLIVHPSGYRFPSNAKVTLNGVEYDCRITPSNGPWGTATAIYAYDYTITVQ